LADACRMPFKDKSFDYVIAFHVLEHVATPDLFLDEMMRVGSSGYIETPNVLYERIKPLDMHLLEVAESGGVLRIRKKPKAVPDPYLKSLNLLSKSSNWAQMFEHSPEAFHVCYHWKGKILYEIDNVQQSLAWFSEPIQGYQVTANHSLVTEPSRRTLRSSIIVFFRCFALLRKRSQPKLEDILVCPNCHHSLQKTPRAYRCVSCSSYYRREPIIDFTAAFIEKEDTSLETI
jgi:Methyltransferase domain